MILLFVMALFIVIWCVGNRLLSEWMVLISPAFSLILIVFVHILLGRKNNSQDKTTTASEKTTFRWWQRWCVLASKRWRWVYVLAVIGLLFNIAILPALSFYIAGRELLERLMAIPGKEYLMHRTDILPDGVNAVVQLLGDLISCQPI